MDLSQKATEYGVKLSHHHLKLIQIYLDELEEWNKRMNLTGLTSRERIINELVLDSLIPSPFLPYSGRMLDVGSGAGFPGILLKIYQPRLNTVLLEASSKKGSFLKQIIRLLRLDAVQVIKGRIERDWDILFQDGYNLITVRALTNLAQTLKWCSPYLLPDGMLINYLGRKGEEELIKSKDIMDQCALILYKMIPYSLPGRRINRSIVIFKKRI